MKKFQFDLPAGIEHNPANWGKVCSQVESSLTQACSNIKKMIRASVTCTVKGNTVERYDPVDNETATNIFDLTNQLIKKTRLTASAALCARVAFMRATWFKDSSESFWNTLDKELLNLYDKVGHGRNQKRLQRAFEAQLRKDRETYGKTDGDYSPPQIGSDFQQSVDELIQVEVISAATLSGSGS
ncbi:hypothetical protein L218DRAFT_1009995 [Marasmius fiardii PR-910]|nr:hypothetical protein L218DRAFT_1009995 [Marasmius fiardii PR-910]